MANMICTQRLYHTADKSKVVAEGDPNAAFLYAVPGDEIPETAVELYGLVDGGLPEKKASKAEKAAAAKAAKEAAEAAAKEAAEKAEYAAKEAAEKEAAEKAAAEAAAKEKAAAETKPVNAAETRGA